MVPDYRIQEAEHSRGLTFVRKAWRLSPDIPTWDHDHCDACFAKIWDRPELQAGSFSEGYVDVEREYRWLCLQCFSDLRATLELKELEIKA